MDLSKEFDIPDEDCRYVPVRYWDINGRHQVAFMRIVRNDDGYTQSYLLCECDFNRRGKTIILGKEGDPSVCPAQKVVRAQAKEEERHYYTEYLKSNSYKDAILHIFQRIEDQEFLGQTTSLIYAQEVAELLSIQWRDVLVFIGELFEEEKLDLNGMILVPYTHRFRFPKEIQQLLRYMIEEPLGWPNGDAGDCFLHDLEKAINNHTSYKSGRDAFEDGGNYPHLAPHILVMFGMKWLQDALTRYAIEAGKGSGTAKADFIETYREVGLLAEQCRLILEQKLR